MINLRPTRGPKSQIRFTTMANLDGFYSLLPRPEEHEQFAKTHGKNKDTKLVQTIGALSKIVDGGADHEFLTSRVPEALLRNASLSLRHLASLGMSEHDCRPVWSSIAHLAMQKTPDQLSAQTIEARQLRLYRWIARGRNDADVSMRLTGQSGTYEARRAAALLPEDTDISCARCGQTPPAQEAIPRSAGCAIRSEGRNISCTYYCGAKCQQEHWSTHKALCTPRRKVIRAAGLLQKLMYALEAAGASEQVADLSTRDGMTVIRDMSQDELLFRGRPVIAPASRGDTSEEEFLAAITTNNCTQIVVTGRRLLELLIKRELTFYRGNT